MLTDDQGNPLFGDLAGDPPGQEPPAPVAPVSSETPPVGGQAIAAAPPAAGTEPTGEQPTVPAEPTAATPEPTEQPEQATPPEPSTAPNWDADDNPWKRQALAAQRLAQEAQAAAMRQQAALRAHQKAQIQAAEARLIANVPNMTPEQIQMGWAQIARAKAEFDRQVEAEQATVQAHIAWNSALAQARAEFGLADEDLAWLNQTARDTDDLWRQAQAIKADREQRASLQAQLRKLSDELTQLRRSQQAAAHGAAVRAGGSQTAPAAMTVPNTPLAQLRAVFGDPNRPIRP